MMRVVRGFYAWMKERQLFKSLLQRNRERMKQLYPGESWERQQEKYYMETILLLMKIGGIGIAVVAAILLYQFSVKRGNLLFVERNEYGEGAERVEIVGYGQEGFQFEGTLEIAEREYTEEELQHLYEKILPIVEENMLGENVSLSLVKTPLVFSEEISGFPFQITWRSSDRSVINSNGELSEEYRDSERAVTIEAEFEYGTFLEKYTWEAKVLPSEWTREQLWEFNVEKELQKSDEQSVTAQQWILPTDVEGKKIYWQTKESDLWLKVLGVLVGGMILIVWGRHNDLQRQLKQRDSSLEEDYSNIVTKLVLYLGAGMTVKSAWKKTAIAQERWKPGSTAAKEMLLTDREMESGIFESVCYENFGKRCGRQEYIRLGALLSQNLRKGNSELLHRLQAEAQASGEKQKHLVKRRGEEASTKLLGPMVLLLGITMVLIMVPAFSGIG